MSLLATLTDERTLEFFAPKYGTITEGVDWYALSPTTIVIKPRLQAFLTTIMLHQRLVEIVPGNLEAPPTSNITHLESIRLPGAVRKSMPAIILKSNTIQVIDQTTTTTTLAPTTTTTTTTTTPRPTTTTTTTTTPTTTQAPSQGFTLTTYSPNIISSNIPIRPSVTLTCEVYFNNNLLDSSLYTFTGPFTLQLNGGFVGFVRIRLVAIANIVHTDIAYKPPGTYWSNNASLNGATTTTGAPTTTTTARPTTTNPPTVGSFTIELVSISAPTTNPKRSAFVGINVPRPRNNDWHLWGNIGYRADSIIPNFIPKSGYAFYDGQTNLPVTNLSLPKSIILGSSNSRDEPDKAPFNFEIPADDSFVQSLPRSIYIGAGPNTLRSNTITIPMPTTTTTTPRPTDSYSVTWDRGPFKATITVRFTGGPKTFTGTLRYNIQSIAVDRRGVSIGIENSTFNVQIFNGEGTATLNEPLYNYVDSYTISHTFTPAT